MRPKKTFQKSHQRHLKNARKQCSIYEMRPEAKASDEPKEPEPVETFETEVKETEKWKEPEPVELTQSQVEQDIPVEEVEQKTEETKEVVLEYETTTKTVQPYEEPVVEEDTRVPQDLDLQSKDQDVSLERLVQSPKPVASPVAEQKEAIYDYEEQREVTVITQTTRIEEKTVNVVEVQEERKDDEPTQEPEVSEPIPVQQESPVRTLQDFDKPIAAQEVQEEETILEATMHAVTDEYTFEHEEPEVVKDEPKTIEEKEPSDEPVIEMDKVEEVKEEVEEAPESPIKETLPKEHESVTHYQETVTTVVTTTEIRGHGGEEEIDGGIFSRPTVQEDTEETNIPGEQVREYVTNVVDSAISQEQSRAEIVDQAKDEPPVDSDSIPEVEDSQTSTKVLEKRTDEVVFKETVQIIEKKQVAFSDEPEEEQAPTVTSESIPDTTEEDIPKEDDSQISTTYTEKETHEVVFKETVQVIDKKQVVFEDEPEEEQAPTVSSESIPDATEEDIPKEDDSQMTTTYIEKETHEIVVKETVQVIEEEKVVFEDEPEEEQVPTVISESIPDTPEEDIPKEDDSQISTTYTERETHEVVVKESVQVIDKKQVVFEDEPEEEQAPTVSSETIPDTPEDIPKEDDSQISTSYTETHEVVVKETVQVIEEEKVVFEDKPAEEQAPTVSSESIPDTTEEDIPKEDDSQISTTYTERETQEVVVKESVQVIDKKQVVFEDEPEEEQVPTVSSESIPDTPKEDDSHITTTYTEKETHEVVVKETVQVIEEEKVVFEDEPEDEQAPTVSSESIPDVLEDIPKEDDSQITTTYTEKETHEIVVKESVQVIDKKQVVFEDEPEEEQVPTVSSESIPDTPEDIPNEDDSQISTSYTETHEVVVKETVRQKAGSL